ncbi:MAG TPA: DUF5107 domain-containing protein [Candidatus Eisenbergiella merdipullorum]|uniref:DUF5107 domain-containing protein n=1 Tax=Candidatus Eisenbergiella merdipullorum TaxID=2838553 RepID=A0A9D2I8N2_9FIRM|nr:DUF5107 domain-containing protein [Candidatus Eisenbergiella merdipullorum]
MKVELRREKRNIPTYVPGKAMDLPMFLEKRPYQGATGRVYPIPVSDSISDEKTDVAYDVYTLENEYVKTDLLPAVGGKILRGYDKCGNYDFIYYNEVIKPALVGLAGPWISGGIEFNFPQHHRPTTYMPAEVAVEEGPSGEKTVWMGEVEPFNRMKGMAGITVEPGRSYIKAKIKVFNRTSQPQLFMWWANLAVPVNETYRTIFPPDVEWVNDHDRRCVMSWPVAKGVYQTARPFDYGKGTDISRYDSVIVPSSFLVSQGQSNMDFVAGYDEGKQMGIATVANHYIAPGKKMWTWGKGDFGEMWCSNLTDENGPYIELMTGVFTDNQPDFTWLKPYESRVFEQYWYPVREIGDVKNASMDAAVNVEKRGDKLFLGFHVTGSFHDAAVRVLDGDRLIFEERMDLKPEKAYLKEIPFGDRRLEDIDVSLYDGTGRKLVGYKAVVRGKKEPITPRKPVLRPEEIESLDELYINGLHLEQYKQHNYDARDYYLEGIRRDPLDARCNTGMARISLKNGQFEDCIRYADAAVTRLTCRNMHPKDTEAMYLKGIAYKATGEYQKAYDVLYMAAWDHSYADAAYYELALLDCMKGEYEKALPHLEESLSRNVRNAKAWDMKAVILRHLGKKEEALEILRRTAADDRLDMFAQTELLKYGGDAAAFAAVFGGKPENYLDVAYDYMSAGFYEDAMAAMELASVEYPLISYVKAYCCHMMKKEEAAKAYVAEAEKMDTGYCFPARNEDIAVLEYAAQCNMQCSLHYDIKGANAPYYLGCLFYDRFAYDRAIALWELAAERNPAHKIVFRNLAIAYFDKRGDFLSAKVCMEKAMENKPGDPRLLLEYQQLLKNMNAAPRQRLKVYDRYHDLMLERDDCYLDAITLYCMEGEYRKAIDMAKNRHFHIYEGGEGKLTKLHAWMHVLYANQLAAEGRSQEAVAMYMEGLHMPKTYGEAKTFFNQESHIYYYLGVLTGKQEYFEEASVYKAAVSEISLFRALALRKLMRFGEAKAVLDEMIEVAENQIKNCDLRTYYGVGSPTPMPFELDIVKANLVSGYVLKAYALLGLGKFNEAEECIKEAQRHDTWDFRIIAYQRIADTVKGE